MTATSAASSAAPARRRFSRRAIAPYVLLAPGLLWLVLFYIYPAIQMFLVSLWTGNIESGYEMTFNVGIYPEALTEYAPWILRSVEYGGLATILAFALGFPLAYTIAFRGGRYKNILLFLVIAPFFTSFLIRTISWKILLGDEGPIFGFLKNDLHLVPTDFTAIGTPLSVIAGLTYNFLPFMILPLYVALEKIDPRLIEAANDLYAGRWEAFRRVTFPLALPGVFAGSILTFIPALGDYVNAELLGSPKTRMIGNVIQARFLQQNDYPLAAALSFLLMIAILIAVLFYARALGTEELAG
jgi:spermidine/putrescine transport system permease protein